MLKTDNAFDLAVRPSADVVANKELVDKAVFALLAQPDFVCKVHRLTEKLLVR